MNPLAPRNPDPSADDPRFRGWKLRISSHEAALVGRAGLSAWLRTSVALAVLLIVSVTTGCHESTPPRTEISERRAGAAITGQVVSQGEVVPDARVRFKGHREWVSTDADGRFRLPARQGVVADRRTVTAAKPGYFIAGSHAEEGMQIELRPLPADDDPAYAWIDPTPDENASLNCGNCHREIYQQWHSGGHARAATNRHFLNLYAGTTWDETRQHGWGLLGEYPEGAGVCTSCHAPSAALDDLGVADIRTINGVPQQGVHCDFCHKVQAVNLTAIGLTHGRFATELLRPEEGQLFLGPLDDVDRGEDSYSPLQGQSQFCAVCHEGVVFGVPVYTTYTEWLQSPARTEGKQCQACHMQPDGKMHNFAPGAGGIERDPTTLASHELLPGGREAMLRQCVEVTPRCQTEPDGVLLDVQLTAHDVGHRVPTGFIDRHLILVIEARDAMGERVEPLAGPRLPAAAGDLAEHPGQLFAKLLIDSDGQSPVPFWRAGTTIEDTRLQPGVPQSVRFRLPVEARDLRIRLIYRRFWQSTAQDKDWPDPTLSIIDKTWSIGDL